MNEDAMKRFEQLSDQELVAVWLAAADPENPTPEEKVALELMEERHIDF
tara:strand:+ start:1183 stop:1329 length:147 start_codon:yes stop_codon:yes gene_type:complete